jgi:hypothetical protein
MSPIDRRFVLTGAGAALVSGAVRAAPFDWPAATPADAGLPGIEARLEKLIASKRAWNLHGVVVARGGRIALER